MANRQPKRFMAAHTTCVLKELQLFKALGLGARGIRQIFDDLPARATCCGLSAWPAWLPQCLYKGKKALSSSLPPSLELKPASWSTKSITSALPQQRGPIWLATDIEQAAEHVRKAEDYQGLAVGPVLPSFPLPISINKIQTFTAYLNYTPNCRLTLAFNLRSLQLCLFMASHQRAVTSAPCAQQTFCRPSILSLAGPMTKEDSRRPAGQRSRICTLLYSPLCSWSFKIPLESLETS